MFKPSTTLRYFTNENGKHYTAVVLKNEKILSLKVAGEKDKTIYDSLIHWLATLPGSVTVSDLDIKEREYSPKKPFKVTKSDTITLKDIAPTYDLLRFLITYEAFSLNNSLCKNVKKFQTKTYVMDSEGNLHPVKYSRVMGKLYSEHHNLMGTSLEELGFPFNADIYVRGDYYGLKQTSPSLEKVVFPFTLDNYEEYYSSKFAFVVTPINSFWKGDNIYKNVCNSLKEKGYYIYSKFFQYHSNKDSIFVNKKFKAFEGNIIVVQPSFNDLYLYKYNPIEFHKIPFSEVSNELKSII
jgi:hypothetical protein